MTPIEYALTTIVFASICISAFGIYVTQVQLIPEEPASLALGYLHAIKDAFGADGIAKLSDEYRDFNPARHVDYPTLRDTLGAEVGFSLSLRQPIEVSLRLEGSTLVIDASYRGGARTAFGVTAYLLHPDRIEVVRTSTAPTGIVKIELDEVPEAVLAFACDSGRGTGTATLNVGRGRGYYTGIGTIRILDEFIEAYVFTKEGFTAIDSAVVPEPVLAPALVAYRDSGWKCIEYPHLFAIGVPEPALGDSAHAILTIGGSSFVLGLEL